MNYNAKLLAPDLVYCSAFCLYFRRCRLRLDIDCLERTKWIAYLIEIGNINQNVLFLLIGTLYHRVFIEKSYQKQINFSPRSYFRKFRKSPRKIR